jgi:hypothetical protein
MNEVIQAVNGLTLPGALVVICLTLAFVYLFKE